MTDNFEIAFQFSVHNEGGYSNHELDKGGATKYGITINTLSQWRRSEVTIEDVKALTIEEAKNIYRTMYFNPLRLDEVNNKVSAAIIFDQAINRGPSTVAKEVQFLLGLKDDGIIGPVTLGELNSVDAKEFQIEFFKICQMAYLNIVKNNPSQFVFLRGWINRTHELLSLIEYIE